MKNLNIILTLIAKKLNLTTNKQEALSNNQLRFLELDFNSNYGGYRLVMVDVKNGGHSGAFGESSACPRKSLKEMTAYLEGILIGVSQIK